MSFAFKLINREKNLEDCTPIFEEKKYSSQLQDLQKLLEPLKSATETGLIVEEDLCSGCANCVVVCPVHASDDPKGMGSGFGATIDDPILRIEDGVVKVINMKKCRRYGKNRILCVACRENCPSSAIRFLEG
jgi:4Fe-4S ferredoxin